MIDGVDKFDKRDLIIWLIEKKYDLQCCFSHFALETRICNAFVVRKGEKLGDRNAMGIQMFKRRVSKELVDAFVSNMYQPATLLKTKLKQDEHFSYKMKVKKLQIAMLVN